VQEEHRRLMAAIILSRRPGFGAKWFRNCVDELGDPLRINELMEKDRLVMIGFGDKAEMSAALPEVERYLKNGGRAVVYGAADYPAPLTELGEPPPYLFRDGPLWPWPERAVGIVGPRRASETALRFTRELARQLAAAGVTIVSGGALGVDAAAHLGALESGATALVTATGIDRYYPPQNAALFDQVRKNGCVLTELLPGTPPRRDFFPTRNRIIAGLSQALVVIGGRLKSGSSSTASQMRRLGRPLFAWTGAANDGGADDAELSAGILAHGGHPLHEPDPSPILEFLPPAMV